MENINRGRQVPGAGSQPDMRRTGGLSFAQVGPTIKKKHCLCGDDIRSCRLGIIVDGKLECSIKVLAIEALKSGIRIGSKNV